MVLMSMSDHKAFDLVQVLFQISHIRNHQINPQHIVRGEGQPAVHHHNMIFIFKSRDIHPDLLQSAQRNDLYLRPPACLLGLSLFLFIRILMTLYLTRLCCSGYFPRFFLFSRILILSALLISSILIMILTVLLIVCPQLISSILFSFPFAHSRQ